MKPIKIIFILSFISFQLLAQFKPFKPNEKKDSIWIKKLLKTETGRQPAIMTKKWTDGKVLYSPDNCLKIGQIVRRDIISGQIIFFRNIIQYMYKGRIIEKYLSELSESDGYYISYFTIKNIYKLPSKNNSYLIIGTRITKSYNGTYDWLGNFLSQLTDSTEQDTYGANTIDYRASMFTLGKDSIRKGVFKADMDNFNSIGGVDFSSGFESNEITISTLIKTNDDCQEPFLKYDSLKNQLIFQSLKCQDGNTYSECTSPYLIIDSGTFEFRDSAFVLIENDSRYCPPLKTIPDTIATNEYKVGNYKIKAIATKKDEEVGEGGIYPILTVQYKIGTQTVEYVNYEYNAEEVLDLTPDCKIQNDSSIFFLTTDITNDYRRGACGSCTYWYSHFWIVGTNYTKDLFSFSSNSGLGFTTYEFNDGKSFGHFYLENDSTEEWEAQIDSSYWKNSSTYVFHVSNLEFARNFYVHFDTRKENPTAKLEIGELIRTKRD